jgi:hypothetical protein
MDVKQIVILVFVLLVIVYLIVNAFSKTNKLTEMAEAKKPQTIKADDLKNSNNSSNFTYSMWIFIDNWNYMFGSEKNILDRTNCPNVVLDTKPNTLKVKIKYYDAEKEVTGAGAGSGGAGIDQAATDAACLACESGYTCACDACNKGVRTSETEEERAARLAAERDAANANTSLHTCVIDNIPIQKWVNVITSLYGRTLDVYVDGKLVRTCVIPGVPRVDNNMDINVTHGGGFSGWTSSFKYWSHASNPQEAYNIYKDGFGGSILGNALSKYRLRFSMVKDNEVQGSFEV